MEFELPFRPLDQLALAPPRHKPRARARLSLGEFGIGIEEEYFLADANTFDLACTTPDRMFEDAQRGGLGQVGREFLQAQIEVATKPHTRMTDAHDDLLALRGNVARAASRQGLAILACGTHPSGSWREAEQSPGDRYSAVMDGLQMIGQRNLLCGMHVHVELPDPDRRVEIMTRMLPYLPLLLALSTSSPFWLGQDTGLKGYRLAAYDELPRTGLPELFWTTADYEAYVDTLVRSGAIKDSSYIWWAVRPSQKYPTLELRAPDCCTRVGDAIAIAALYRTLARHLYRNPMLHRDLDVIGRGIAVENKWRAQRYGVHGTFVTDDGAVSVAELVDNVLYEIREDADALGCATEIERCRAIVAHGTSADAQLAAFRSHPEADRAGALRAAAHWIAAASVRP